MSTKVKTLDPAIVVRLTGVLAGSGPRVTVSAPATGKVLATLPQSNAEDIHKVYAAARDAQRGWAEWSPAKRAAIFVRLHDLVLGKQSEGLDILQAETGKARKHAFEEIMEVAVCALYFGRRTPKLLKPRRRAGAFPVLTKAIEIRKPKGVVTVITPWNYPLALTDDVFPALLAGNTVVQKPDNQTALSALWLRELAIEAGLPPEAWTIVLGDRHSIGSLIIEEANYVAFTGSTGAGKAIGEQAAKNLIGCSLELGGKNPMVVLADANLDRAATGAVRACFNNAGQLCVSIERLYVHESVRDEFTRKFVGKVKNMTLGAGFDYHDDMGSLTYRRQLDSVVAHVEEAKAKGAHVLTGGKARPDVGPLFYEPTVLENVTEDIALCREETFGPVVSIYSFRTDDEAVALANDTEYGLNASVWSRSEKHARAVGERIEAGTVNINEGYAATYGSQGAPMGGMKSSGLGRRHGDEGLLKLTEAQQVTSQRVLGFDPQFGLGHGTFAKILTIGLRLAKAFRIR
jgi:succinate-semialdehyde dehydrogenase/glutarate-semialdehyde dehydrogenase